VSEAIYDFPVTWRPQVNTKRLVQMRIDDEFIKAVDIWRDGQTDRLARTEAIRRLAAIGGGSDVTRCQTAKEDYRAPASAHFSRLLRILSPFRPPHVTVR
jgi:hypothetical protein